MKCGLRACDLVGSLTPGIHPLEGKSFYLDEVKSRPSTVITELIGRLGGKVESFLHKDVSVVVTGNREALTDGPLGKIKTEPAASPRLQKVAVNSAQRPGTPRPLVCGSRGKALLEKAIRNNEKSQGGVLSNARSWGVKIVGVDDFLKIVDQLTVELSAHKSKRLGKKGVECSGQRVKGGSLKADFLKVEDSCRKYRPLHAQSLTFPTLSYTGKFSPFEPPAPPRPGKRKEGEDKLRKSDESVSSFDKPSALLPQTPSPRRPRKKSLGYCECCQISYKDQDEHLQSDVHRHFVEDVANYAVVDKLVAGMGADFSYRSDQQDDKLLIRLSSCSPAPLSSLAEMEEQIESETGRDPQNIPNQSSNQLLGDMNLDTVNLKLSFEPFCDPLFQPQEPDRAPQTFFETSSVDEKVKIHLVLPPNPETHVPSHCKEDFPCVIPSNEPLPQVPVPVPYTTQIVQQNTADDLAKLDCVPNPGPSLQPKVDKREDSTVSSDNSNQKLSDYYGEKVAVDEEGGAQMVVECVEIPLNVKLNERDQNSERKSQLGVSSSLSVYSCRSGNLSAKVNSRKRSRSFTLSPKASKKMRTNHWSEPPDKNASFSASFDYGPFVYPGLLPMAEKHDANDIEANCIEGSTSIKCELEACKDLSHSCFQSRTFTNTTSPQDDSFFQHNQHRNCGTQETRVTGQHPNRVAELESHVVVDSTGDKSSELGPPQLYPFYHDDHHQQQLPFLDPPNLIPATALPSAGNGARPPASQLSSTSLLSQSFSSVCIESALIPDFTFSPTSSESDWDSGLLSRLAPTVNLPTQGERGELDLGLLLQRSCAGVQDGSYASQLCSVLQPTIRSSVGFEDPVNLNALYRPLETMDRRIIQSLGV